MSSETFGHVGAFRFWCQKVLPAVYDDSLSYYELLCKVVDYMNNLAEITNTQSDAITELQSILQDFMEGTFDPLIEAKIEEWFEENEISIIERLDAIEANHWVTSNRIDTGAVTNPKIADGAVTVSKIGDAAITLSKIADGNVSFDKLTPTLQTRITNLEAPITPNRLDTGAVTVSKIADGAVTMSKIADGNVSFDKLTPTMQARINSLEAGRKYLVIIGDSFSYSAGGYTETPYWWQYTQVRCSLLIKNYAQGGCGYTVGSKTFLQQAMDAAADTSFSHADVAYVVVLGGVNDHGGYTTTLVNQVLQALQPEFSNARILFAFNTGQGRQDSNASRETILEWLSTAGVPHCSLACIENVNGAIKASDNIHPTAMGSALIATLIEANLGIGTYNYVNTSWSIPVNISNNLYTISTKRGEIRGNVLHMSIRVQQTGDPSYQTCRLTLPTIIAREYSGAWYRYPLMKFTSVNGHANHLVDGTYLIAQNDHALTIDINPYDVNANDTTYSLDFDVILM